MRKSLKLLVLGFICFSLWFPVEASTRTNTRTENNNYLVQNSVTINENALEDIMKTPAVDATEKIYDFANLFNVEEEAQLYQHILEIVNNYGVDFVVVTTKENEFSGSAAYADSFYRYNNFGKGTGKAAIVFLIDMKYKGIYFYPSTALESLYSGKINGILTSVITDFKNKDYYQGTLNVITEAEQYLTELAPQTVKNEKKLSKAPWASLFLLSAIITAVTIGILIKKNKMVGKANSSSEFLVKDNSDIKIVSDTFMGSNITKSPKNNNGAGNKI